MVRLITESTPQRCAMTEPALARFAVRLLDRVASSRDTLNGSNSQSMHRLCFATVWPRCAFQSESHCRYYYKVSRGHVRNRTIDECVLDDQCMPLDRASERNESDPYVRVFFATPMLAVTVERIRAHCSGCWRRSATTTRRCTFAEWRPSAGRHAQPSRTSGLSNLAVPTVGEHRAVDRLGACWHCTAAHTTRSRVGQAERGEQARLQGVLGTAVHATP